MNNRQEFAIGVEVVVYQFDDPVHVPGERTEVERALSVDILDPVEAQVLLADHEPGGIGHPADLAVVAARQIAVSGTVFGQQQLHLANFLERQRHTEPGDGIGAGVGVTDHQ